MSAIRSPCWSWASYRRRPVRSASSSRRWKSDGRRILRPPWTRLRSRGRTLCLSRPAHAGQQVAHQHLGPARAPAGDARLSGVHRSGGPNVVRTELPGFVPAHRRLCRQDSTRGEARRPSGRAADQVRSGHQPYDRQGARARSTSDVARPRRRGDRMKRRQFITLIGGATAAWPFAARAQQPDRARRIGVLMSTAVDDPQDPARLAAFAQGLQELGWTIGRNLRVDYRWGASSPDNARKYAAELAALAPDVMLASGTIALAAAQQIRHTIPVVFVNLVDPVSGGFVESLARPGGNATGFLLFEYGISGKWLALLKEIAPRVMRVAVLRDPTQTSGAGQVGAIQSAASQLGVEFRPVGVRDAREIERGISDFGRGSNGGLIVAASTQAREYGELIIGLAARHRLPAVYFNRLFVEAGGLISYGPDFVDQFRRAANYVDRVLKGEKPADLPVQAPTKFELVINLKTAKALGIDVPATVLARADEVIE